VTPQATNSMSLWILKYTSFPWFLKLLTLYKCHCSHPVQIYL